MPDRPTNAWSRRRFLRLGAALGVPSAAAAAGGVALGRNAFGRPASAQELPLTPECREADDLTPAQTEGPYFTRNSPERQSLLAPDVVGSKLVVAGYVLTRGCQPVAGALLDFWQADGNGQYDNVGYRLRGHQVTDSAGRYYLETVLPGLYPGRTRHIHVKVQAPNGPVLTTQLYFPDEPRNRQDRIFNPALVLRMVDAPDGQAGTFNFVLRTA